MTYRVAAAIVAATTLAACMPQRPETPQIQPEVVPPGPVVRPPAPTPPPAQPMARATNLADYKIEVAKRIASSSPDLFGDPLPPMLKSIVVLDIAIDRNGQPQQVSVRRSNGIKQLEQRAQTSVRRAAPFNAPAPELLGGTSAVRFLETFLFRDDGRFQIRSLVETPQ